ncbi:MAG: hypothetical protein FJ388_13650 [Verrucomicrobia bacterium]|nr:hypothetical protein [Verrucomicrobiota bacterium]
MNMLALQQPNWKSGCVNFRLAVLLLVASALDASAAVVPAFPGAEGFGAQSAGGRGGRVIEVTTLADSGLGSFRAAVEAAGPRIVVFRVAGIIELKSRIDIGQPFLTIAGQTAPGGGITLQGTPEGGGQMLRIRTHDVVIRYLRIRSGAHGQPGKGQVNISLDPLPAQGNRYGNVFNIMIDHVSVSWSFDENIAIFRNVPGDDPQAWEAYPRIYNVTVQRSIIAEGLYPHSTGIQVGGERVMRDGRSVFNGGHGVYNLDIHHNLFANTSHRCPGLGSKSARVINNVMYNWGSKCGETHDAISVDWIANWFQPGPLSAARRILVHNDFSKGHPQNRFGAPSIHMSGNVNAAMTDHPDWSLYEIHYENRELPAAYRRGAAMPQPEPPVRITPPVEAFRSVLADAGANARLNETGELLPNSDAADRRILDDVRLKRGNGVQTEGHRTHYTHPDQVGGYPKIEPGAPYADADHDGMADAWERKHHLHPDDPSDAKADRDEDGYTNIEEFLNQTNPLVRNH